MDTFRHAEVTARGTATTMRIPPCAMLTTP